MNIEDLIYGTSKTERIVACDYDDDDNLEVWREIDGQVVSEKHQVPYFLISSRASTESIELAGTLPLKHLRTFQTKQDYWNERRRQQGALFLNLYDDREAAMMLSGITFFKGMEPRDVSVLSVDIESTGLVKDETSKVLLISNSFQKDGIIIRKLFAYDDYSTEGEMLTKWCEWVREMNPSIITGHNIYSYDLPYMDYCARQSGVSLNLGRDGSPMRFNNYESNFRVDQSNFYPFYNALIYGRSIVDTYFLSMRYDYVEKKYSSYGLKNIIKEEGLERQGRVYYDAGQIRLRYKEPEEWAKIKVYAEHDADDSLALYNIMIPAYFYLTKSVPKHFQIVMTSAPGAQINSLMTRAYVQLSHSLPLPTDIDTFEGAISLGNPGVYEHVFKVDVNGLYPSIMLQYEVCDKEKDPLNVMLQILEYLTKERLNNKKLAQETGKRSYKSLSDAQKIIVNSFYGFLNTRGLTFNSPKNGAEVTRHGREILTHGMNITKELGFTLVNADTDSVSITDGKPWDKERRNNFLQSFNKQFPEKIIWADDGYYDRVLVLKTKNYVLDKGDKRNIKGSALKASLKSPALKEFINTTINALIMKEENNIPQIYTKYVKEICNIKDIKRWASKKSISESVLFPTRTNEKKVLEALNGIDIVQGDKVYLYFKQDDSLGIVDKWNQDHSVPRLLKALHDTLEVFETVYDPKQCLNYALKKNQKLLPSLL